jgi:endonuclease G
MKRIVIYMVLMVSAVITFLVLTQKETNAALSGPLFSTECNGQVPFGKPTSNRTNTTLVCRKAYMLEHDNNSKIPVWVSYVLTPEHTVGCVRRSNAFRADTSLPAYSTPKDYSHSGYDIGHQANDEDMSWDVDVERESFLLSNMAPQVPGFNRGIWKDLEDQTRAWASNRQHSLLIYVGPIYNKNDKTIGNGVTVPHAFYKIIFDMTTHEAIVTEFLNQASNANLNSFIVPFEKVEADTGINFPLLFNVQFSKTMWPSPTKSIRKQKATVCSS